MCQDHLTTTQSADHASSPSGMQFSTPVQGSTPMLGEGLTIDTAEEAEVSDKDSDADEDSGEEECDSDECEFGPNLSLPGFNYMYRCDRRCTYCGAYKGIAGKTIMECSKDGRKICARCYPNTYKGHRKYFKECTTGYVKE